MDCVSPKELDIHPDDPTLVFRKGRWTKRRKQSRYEEVDGEMCRLCTTCDNLLPLDHFTKLGKGLLATCRRCRSDERSIMKTAPICEAVRSVDDSLPYAYERREIEIHGNLPPITRRGTSREQCPYAEIDGVMNRLCKVCDRYVPIDQFGTKVTCAGRKITKSTCAECKRKQSKIYDDANRERKNRNGSERYYRDHEASKAKGRETSKRCRLNSRERVRNRLKTDPSFRLIHNLRRSLLEALEVGRDKKASKTIEMIGCSPQELVRHLEAQFESGMSWDNYGAWRYGEPMKWHVDHIRRVVSFDFSDPTQQRACFHYTNLQPLWAVENMEKSDRLDWVKTRT